MKRNLMLGALLLTMIVPVFGARNHQKRLIAWVAQRPEAIPTRAVTIVVTAPELTIQEAAKKYAEQAIASGELLRTYDTTVERSSETEEHLLAALNRLTKRFAASTNQDMIRRSITTLRRAYNNPALRSEQACQSMQENIQALVTQALTLAAREGQEALTKMRKLLEADIEPATDIAICAIMRKHIKAQATKLATPAPEATPAPSKGIIARLLGY